MFNRTISSKGVFLLAWIAYLLGHVAGWAITASWMGNVLSGMVGWLPDSWIPAIFWVGFVWMCLALVFGRSDAGTPGVDWMPTRPAVWGAILLPSVAAAIHGEVGRQVNAWGDAINAWASHT